MMHYGNIEGVDKPVSRLVLGTMIVNSRERERSFALLDAAFAQGCNALDTAHVYAEGYSERGIGEWMQARGNRKEMVIISKGCHHNADRKRVTPFDLAADLTPLVVSAQVGGAGLDVGHNAIAKGPDIEGHRITFAVQASDLDDGGEVTGFELGDHLAQGCLGLG